MGLWNFLKRIVGFGKDAYVRERENRLTERDHIYYSYEIDEDIADLSGQFERITEFLKAEYGSDVVAYNFPTATPDRMERELQVEINGETLFLTRYRGAEVVLRGPEAETKRVKDTIDRILGVKPKRV